MLSIASDFRASIDRGQSGMAVPWCVVPDRPDISDITDLLVFSLINVSGIYIEWCKYKNKISSE